MKTPAPVRRQRSLGPFPRRVAAVPALLAAFAAAAGQDVHFAREDLVFRLQTDSLGGARLDVTGVYAFRNENAAARRLQVRYPVPIDRWMGTPSWLSVERIPADRDVEWRIQERGALSISTPLESGEEALLVIHYCQPVSGGRFTYLLTTALGWRRPIDEAHFLLELPAGWVVDSCSLAADDQRADSTGTRWLWSRRDFVPDGDFVCWFGLAE